MLNQNTNILYALKYIPYEGAPDHQHEWLCENRTDFVYLTKYFEYDERNFHSFPEWQNRFLTTKRD